MLAELRHKFLPASFVQKRAVADRANSRAIQVFSNLLKPFGGTSPVNNLTSLAALLHARTPRTNFDDVLVGRLPVGRVRRGSPVLAAVYRWTCRVVGRNRDRFH